MDLEAKPETRNWSIALKREGTAGRSPRNDKCTRVSWHSQPAAQTWAQLPGLMVNHKLSQPSNPCPDATSTTRPCVPAQAPGCRDTRSSRLLYKYNLPASPSLGKSTCPAIALLVELRQEVLAVSPAKLCDSNSPGALLEPPSRHLIPMPLLFSRYNLPESGIREACCRPRLTQSGSGPWMAPGLPRLGSRADSPCSPEGAILEYHEYHVKQVNEP
jgi:hypothetical protein